MFYAQQKFIKYVINNSVMCITPQVFVSKAEQDDYQIKPQA